jgi:hypothetical protein
MSPADEDDQTARYDEVEAISNCKTGPPDHGLKGYIVPGSPSSGLDGLFPYIWCLFSHSNRIR